MESQNQERMCVLWTMVAMLFGMESARAFLFKQIHLTLPQINFCLIGMR